VAVSAVTISACRYWLGLVLSRDSRIGRDVWHTVVACPRSECSSEARDRTDLSVRRQEPDHEQSADGCGYQGEHLFSRRVRRSFQQEEGPGPQVSYPDSCALLQGPQPPRKHIMSCALRCKAVSPPKLDHPRTNGFRSEGIHRASTPG
jgi:hypothetical protein